MVGITITIHITVTTQILTKLLEETLGIITTKLIQGEGDHPPKVAKATNGTAGITTDIRSSSSSNSITAMIIKDLIKEPSKDPSKDPIKDGMIAVDRAIVVVIEAAVVVRAAEIMVAEEKDTGEAAGVIVATINIVRDQEKTTKIDIEGNGWMDDRKWYAKESTIFCDVRYSMIILYYNIIRCCSFALFE